MAIIIHLNETDSTNRWLMENGDAEQDQVVWADYQTSGRGCGQNTWESQRGENLLFSLLIHPQQLLATRQFGISMAISVAIVRTLSEFIAPFLPADAKTDDLSIKWPNDIYWKDCKLAGILIENRLSGQYIRDSIVGVGLNVNQTEFKSDAPNPVSLRQITGCEHDREALLQRLMEHFTFNIERSDYLSLLYRREGFYPYRDQEGLFEAELITVEDDGHILLCDRSRRERRYAFKEVSFII